LRALRSAMDSNWLKIQTTIKRFRPIAQATQTLPDTQAVKKHKPEASPPPSESLSPPPLTNVLALDCEFVGVGSKMRDALARVSLVNFHGQVVLDSFVKPDEKVTDFRTRFSGVRREDLVGDNVLSFVQAQLKVSELIYNRILVGHSIDNDLKVLGLSHPKKLVRDTALFRPLCPRGKRSLKKLALEHLNRNIQGQEHCSVSRCLSSC